MNPEDKRVVKTKRAIRQALLEKLESKPLSEITIKEISDSACINRKTFYAHYASVDEILSELEDEIVGSVAYFLEEVLFGEYNVGPQYVLQCINTIYAENPQFFENLVSMRNYTFLAEKFKKVFKEQLLRSLKVPEGKTDEASAVLEFFIGGAAALYVDWIRKGKKIPFEQVTSLLAGLVSEGAHAVSGLL